MQRAFGLACARTPFVGDPWLSITLTLCHILHSVSHWPVSVYFINSIPADSAAQLLVIPGTPSSGKGCMVITCMRLSSYPLSCDRLRACGLRCTHRYGSLMNRFCQQHHHNLLTAAAVLPPSLSIDSPTAHVILANFKLASEATHSMLHCFGQRSLQPPPSPPAEGPACPYRAEHMCHCLSQCFNRGQKVALTATMQPQPFSCLRTWPVKQDRGYSSTHSSSSSCCCTTAAHAAVSSVGSFAVYAKSIRHQPGAGVSPWAQEVKHSQRIPCSLGVGQHNVPASHKGWGRTLKAQSTSIKA
jgi:hypothetical protein